MRRTLGLTSGAVGVLALAAGVLWTPLVVPRTVKFPASIDETLRFEGTATLPLDATTALPLATPIEVPLQLERRLESVEGGTGARRAVVAEAISLRLGDRTVTERQQYVLDRREMTMVTDPRSWAYDPANVVDRGGSYRINLPLGTSADGGYRVWNNETGSTITLAKGSKTRSEVADVDVVAFPVTLRKPVAGYFGDRLVELGLPTELTPAQLAARLSAAGVDFRSLGAALGPKLNAEQLTGFSALAQTPLPLRYEFFIEETIWVEPRTGIIVDVDVVREGFAAKPDLAPLAAIEPILAANVNLPDVAKAAELFTQLQKQPADTVLELRYRATDATVADRGSEARSYARRIRFAEFWAPWGLGLAGAVLIGVGAALFLWRRPGPSTPPLAAPSSSPDASAADAWPEPVASGPQRPVPPEPERAEDTAGRGSSVGG